MSNYKHIVAGDTDSVYCSLPESITGHRTNKQIIKLGDDLGEELNTGFPQFMMDNFLISRDQGRIIVAGREVVATHGLFKDVKKRYALHVIDLEGKATDKMKIMGMETKRSDTPKIIQDFLEHCLTMVVKERASYDELREVVDDFRINTWREQPTWLRGTPCRVSNLTKNSQLIMSYNHAIEEGLLGIKKPRIHYSVAAAVNTNILIENLGEHRWDLIRDGDKIEVLYLLDNQYDMRSIARKVDDSFVPDWFKELPFDNDSHEFKMVDKKLDNVIGSVLDWTFEPVSDYRDEVFETEDFF